jgi:uncharacterized oligopeptide transporter (OPT) family protein
MANLMKGAALPEQVLPFCVVAAIWAAAVTCLEHLKATDRVLPHGLLILLRYCPSPTAVAIGMYVTPNWTIPRVIGAVVAEMWRRWHEQSHRTSMVMVATGLVLGEGITSIVTAFISTAGVQPLTCSGCAPSMCGNGCP